MAQTKLMTSAQSSDNSFDLDIFKSISLLAESFKNSGAFPAHLTKEQMIVQIQAGREVGLGPVKSLNSFYFIQGKVAIHGSARTELLARHGYVIQWVVDTATEVEANIIDTKTGFAHNIKFDLKDLQRMGKSNPVYIKHPRRFLKHKLLNEFVATVAGDVLGGFPVIDELEIEEDRKKVTQVEANEILNEFMEENNIETEKQTNK